MAHGGQVVDLVGLDLLDQAGEVGAVGHIPVMQAVPHMGVVRVLVEVVDALGVERRGPPLQPVHLIALLEQQFAQVGAVLPRNPGNECYFFFHSLVCFIPGPTPKPRAPIFKSTP